MNFRENMLSAIDANSLEMRIEIQRRDKKDDKGTNMRRGWFEWKTTLYNWDCRRVDELSHKEVSSLDLRCTSLSFPLPFSPLSSTPLRLSTFVNGFIVIVWSKGLDKSLLAERLLETKRNTVRDDEESDKQEGEDFVVQKN